MAKFNTKYSKKLAEYIADELMFKGVTPYELCAKEQKKDPSFPSIRSVYRWQNEHKEFKDMMDAAYSAYLDSLFVELRDLNNKTATEIFPDVEFREAAEAAKRKADTLKFTLGKLAPVMSNRFDKASKIQHEGKVQGPNIVIQSYSTKDVKNEDI